jgi:hypothetical protein
VRGLDYAWSHVPPWAVKAAGFGFVARYLSHDASKSLSKSEAAALRVSGIAIVVVWEDAAQGALRGHAGGVADALAADSQARACGMPGAFIYFAADWDATAPEQGVINDYLDGAASIIGRARTGLYGGYWACSRARTAGKASKFWGTVAWSGSNWDPARNPNVFKPDVMQGAQVTIDGVSVDLDTADAAGDFGQWPRPATTAIPMPATPVTVPVEAPEMIIFEVDKGSVPAGNAWPGIFFLLIADGSLHHITSTADVANYKAAGALVPPKPFTYAEFLARGGVPVPLT